jgi:uncharacterized protein involved in exopolysaccharide biosynthesis
MVSDDIIKKYSQKEASELRVYCVALDTENNILRAQLQSLREERNKLLKKLSDVELSNDNRQPPQQNSGLPPAPRFNRPQ